MVRAASSSSSVNGRKRVQLQFSLSGGGSATLRGESQGAGGLHLAELQVRAGGQVIDVLVGAGGEVIDVESK